MKKSTIFVGLKIAEVIGIILIFFLIWNVGNFFIDETCEESRMFTLPEDCSNSENLGHNLHRFMLGLLIIMVSSFILFFLGYLLKGLVEMNLEWANDIHNKYFKKKKRKK